MIISAQMANIRYKNSPPDSGEAAVCSSYLDDPMQSKEVECRPTRLENEQVRRDE